MLIEQRRKGPVVALAAEPETFDLEAILPLEMIRHHTKTEDIITVLDSQLELYRAAALEAAEAYVGISFQRQRTVMLLPPEPYLRRIVHVTDYFEMIRETHWVYETKHPFAHNFAYVYGGRGRSRRVPVQPGSSSARIPFGTAGTKIAFNDCCGGSYGNDDEDGMRINYVTGFTCTEAIPAALRLGALKYIAHVIENSGDVTMVFGTTGQTSTGSRVSDAASPALASGAIDIWRSINPRAI